MKEILIGSMTTALFAAAAISIYAAVIWIMVLVIDSFRRYVRIGFIKWASVSIFLLFLDIFLFKAALAIIEGEHGFMYPLLGAPALAIIISFFFIVICFVNTDFFHKMRYGDFIDNFLNHLARGKQHGKT